MEAAKARTGGGPARVVTSMLTRNLGAKGLALVCAIVLWLYMREQVQTDHDEYFEVLASGSEASYMIAYPESEDLIIRPETGSDRIRINFAGPTEQVNTIKNGRIRGTIPASVFDEWLRAGEEEGTLAVGLGDIEFPTVPNDVIATLPDSPTLAFNVKRRGRKTMTVSVRLDRPDHPDEGFQFGTPVPVPSRVSVTGPQSWLAARETIELEPV